MKKYILLLLLTIFLFKINAIGTSHPEMFFSYSSFNSPESPYIETYLSVIGNSVKFAENDKGLFQAKFEVHTIINKADEVIVDDKYFFLGPEIDDTLGSMPNFIDQQRYMLDNGIYNIQVQIKDLNSEVGPTVFYDIVSIDYKGNDLMFSDIQLIERAVETEVISLTTKGDYDLVPYVSNFYPDNLNTIMFYVEIYNTDKAINDDFILRYYVKNNETKMEMPGITRFRRFSHKEIIPFVGQLNIENLRSGNYLLVMEIVDREQQVLKNTKMFFQRSNFVEFEQHAKDFSSYEFERTFDGHVSNIDSLREYISSLRPIARGNEEVFIDHRLNSSDMRVLQNFFHDFWTNRYPNEPNKYWMIYKEQVDFVNKNYDTFISKGYQTDRGRVYLQYGAPNSIYSSQYEPSAYPYEIWHYDEIATERNRRFVFYNPSIVGEEYIILHSELTGEIKNNNWERILHSRDNVIYDFDQMHADPHWGGRARDEFRK